MMDSSQLSEIFEDIFENTKDRIHCPIGDFKLRTDNEEISKLADEKALAVLQATPFVSPNQFISWFTTVCGSKLDSSQGSWQSSVTSGGAHIFLSLSTKPIGQAWEDVQVIGNFCLDNSTNYLDGLLDLAFLAQQVFVSQPLRLFLYGLYIRTSRLELWRFDRSGIWCCQTFDIQSAPEHFLSLIFTCQLMTDQDLGQGNIVKHDEKGIYVLLDGLFESSLNKLYLDNNAIASSEDIVGQGTTCYRARLADSDRWDYVVKFAWRVEDHRSEEEMLKLAIHKRSWGILSLHYDKGITSTARLRKGLKFGPYSEILPTLGQSDKPEMLANSDGDALGIERYTRATKMPFESRELACIVTSPVGRPLASFTSRLELLLAMRDAMRAHRSLLQDARILHQDVSIWNIIIVSPSNSSEPHGILIDLDGSMNLDVGPRNEGEVIGTRPFMSIGILHSRRHTYRHDLESFLYVLIWLVIVKDKGSPPPGSRLKMWNRGAWQDSAEVKEHDMAEENFDKMILSEFPPEYESFKPLARRIRGALFPMEDGRVWTGTYGSVTATNALYDGLIGAFEDAILRERSSSS